MHTCFGKLMEDDQNIYIIDVKLISLLIKNVLYILPFSYFTINHFYYYYYFFLGLVEEGYHSTNPYHNSIHATDVTQAMHCFLQEEKVIKRKISIYPN